MSTIWANFLCVCLTSNSVARRVDVPNRPPAERPAHGRGHGGRLPHRRLGQEEPRRVQGEPVVYTYFWMRDI